MYYLQTYPVTSGTSTAVASTTTNGTAFTFTEQSFTYVKSGLLALGALSVPTAFSYLGYYDSNIPPIVPGSSSNLKFSPYNWRINNNIAITNNPGAYLNSSFAGTNLKLVVDTSSLVSSGVPAGYYPKIRWSIDDNSWQSATLNSSNNTIILGAGLTNTEHKLKLYFLGIDYTLNRWSSETGALKIVRLDSSATSSLVPSLKPKKLIIYGDSITEGLAIEGSKLSNSMASYAALVGEGFNAEYGQIGFGGQGWTVAGTGSVPKFTETWNNYSSSTSRLIAGKLSPVPDYLIVLHGTNDALAAPPATDGDVTKAVSNWLTAARVAAGNECEIFVVSPFGLFKNSAISLGVSNYLSLSGDSKTSFVGLGVSASTGLTSFALGLNAFSTDGIHPNIFNSVRLAPIIISEIRETVLNRISKPVSSVHNTTG